MAMRGGRLGCVAWLVIAGLPVLLALLGGWWWYCSDGDLDALARDPRMPPVAPPAVVEATAEQAAALRRLMAAWEEATAVSGEPMRPLTAEFRARLHRDATAAGSTAGGSTGGSIAGGGSTAGIDPRSAAAQEAGTAVCGLFILLCTRLRDHEADPAALVDDAVTLSTIAGEVWGCLSVGDLTSAMAGRAAELRGTAAGAAVAGSLRRLREVLWRSRGDLAARDWRMCLAELRGRQIDLSPFPAMSATDERLRVPWLRLLQRVDRAAALRRMAADWQDAVAAADPADLRARSGRRPPLDLPWPADSASRYAAYLRQGPPNGLLLEALDGIDRAIAEVEGAPAAGVGR